MAAGEHTVVTNRRARHEFEVLERLEAGLALMGTEVKSLRAGKVVIRDAYATEKDGELWLVNATIEPYAQGNRENHEPTRDRKLLVRQGRARSARLARRGEGAHARPAADLLQGRAREGRDRAGARP